MGSPFNTAEEYLGATGPMHSFTAHPATATVFLLISLALSCWFLYKAFTLHH
jgi:hypothetical protein